jgi:hypothetical protein
LQGTQGIQGPLSTFQGTQGSQGLQGLQGLSGLNLLSTDNTWTGTNTFPQIFVTNEYATGVVTFTTGPLLVGTGTPTGTANQLLQIAGGAYISGVGASVGIGTTVPTQALHVIGNILASGTVTANSDFKLKTNIQTIPNALQKTIQLRGVEYDRVDMSEHQIGVIAQEVEKVIPEVVIDNNGIKSVAYGNLVGLLIEAIKEQQKEIEILKSKLG